MRRRTRARELAVQFLYQQDLRGEDLLEDLEGFLDMESDDETVRTFATRLTLGTREHQQDTDTCLKEVARNWDLGPNKS